MGMALSVSVEQRAQSHGTQPAHWECDAPRTDSVVQLRTGFKSTAHEYLSISCHNTGIERPGCDDRLPSHISKMVVSTVHVGGLGRSREASNRIERVSYSYQPEPMISPSWRITQECLIPSSPVAGLTKT